MNIYYKNGQKSAALDGTAGEKQNQELILQFEREQLRESWTAQSKITCTSMDGGKFYQHMARFIPKSKFDQ